jgi:hypothetical protein
MTNERLRVLDELEAPDLWGEIEDRRPASAQVASGMSGRRSLTVLIAAAVGLTAILIANSALGPTERRIGPLDTSAWRTSEVPTLHLKFRHPDSWFVQVVDETIGHIGFQGAAVSNIRHRFRHPDLGRNEATSLWDLRELPPDSVVVSIEHIEGGPMTNEELIDSELPLNFGHRRNVPTPSPGPGWEEGWLPFVMDGKSDTVRVWVGADASEREREIARRIVASIAPVADDFDGWNVGVEVEHSNSGPLEIEVGPIQGAPANDAHPWVQHTVILRNTGSETLHFDDTRFSTFIGPPGHRLLAADQGCGYGSDLPGAPVQAGACLLYLDAFSIPPHGKVERTVTLYKDLPGMAQLTEGRYVFRKIYRFSVGASDQKTTVHVRLIYDVEKA